MLIKVPPWAVSKSFPRPPCSSRTQKTASPFLSPTPPPLPPAASDPSATFKRKRVFFPRRDFRSTSFSAITMTLPPPLRRLEISSRGLILQSLPEKAAQTLLRGVTARDVREGEVLRPRHLDPPGPELLLQLRDPHTLPR